MTTMRGSREGSGAAILLDSNVLVHAVDRREPDKRGVAQRIVTELTRARRAVASTQTLGEFFRVSTRGIPDPLSAEDAGSMVSGWNTIWHVYGIAPHTMLEAVRGHLRYGFPYWDAQLWATARLNHLPLVLSEDFSDGSEVEGVRFSNPFADGFDLEALLAP